MEFQAPTEALRLFSYHLAELMRPDLSGTEPLMLTVKREGDGFAASARLRESCATASAPLSIHATEGRTEHVAAAKALYEIYLRFGGIRPPYGTLVGVRPVKMALFYLERGACPEDAERILTEEYAVLPEKAHLLCLLAARELAAARALSDTDAMLYLSIPFCPSRCRYCSFISHSAPKQLSLLPDYLARMHEELNEIARLFSETGRRLRAVYLGGGTPGILSADELDLLFARIEKEFPLSDATEYTAELGRPDTITREKCDVLHAHGVGRICINPQSLSDEVLRINGRLHTAAEFYRAVDDARSAGIPVINCDLIAGLSGDTPEGFLLSEAGVRALSPENITIHALCKKRASEEEGDVETDEDHRWADAMEIAAGRCINAGYVPYYLYRQKHTIAGLENLGYARGGTDCLYNIAMMEDLCDVFAVGAGAMTKLYRKTPDGYKMLRFPAYKYPAEYLADPKKGAANRERVRQIFKENTK